MKFLYGVLITTLEIEASINKANFRRNGNRIQTKLEFSSKLHLECEKKDKYRESDFHKIRNSSYYLLYDEGNLRFVVSTQLETINREIIIYEVVRRGRLTLVSNSKGD
eukprot:Gregarina_sp_Poly_1__4665@NODE_2492_length_2063_cov_14_671343_g1582_i0_p1_GENE_NODE_2492_length_2063_cov_14_671343_g1582_i0NODE_2492_length_2063_cov_14_671343_g1582_i0_p1_ORF_typecomplete_len108_score6_37_NODE_2492_length_2063_cov_14_671343_g1582_i011211444